MDKSTTPGGAGPTNPPWPEDSGSESGFGATGVFGTLSMPAQAETPGAGQGSETERVRNAAPAAAKPQPVLGAKPLQEPVVHKVVFGGGEESSAQLLDRIRAASAERAAIQEKPAAPASGGIGSGGFTELLRSIGGESSAPAPAARQAAMPEARAAAPVSGFTSLLQTLNAPETKAPAAANPVAANQVAANQVRAELRAAPVVPARRTPAAGSFTELLRVTGTETPESPSTQAPSHGLGEMPPGVLSPAPAGSKLGTFTQLFSTFAEKETSAPTPVAREPEAPYSGGGPGSFTRMLSLEQQSEAPAPAFHEERAASAGDRDYGFSPGTVDKGRTDAAAPSRDPFAQTLPEAPPMVESTPQSSGMGITRLIQMLDEPATIPAPVAPPVSAPGGEGPGVWTRTFASLEPSGEAKPGAANPPSGAPAPQVGLGGAPAAVNEFTPKVAPAASLPTGPSEFTRILDASRLREEVMRGGPAGASAAGMPSAQDFAPPRPAVPMPGFPAAAPVPPAMPAMRPMAQPGGFAPPQAPPAPTYPMNFAPPVPHAGLPQAPPVPQPPAVKAPPAGVGKLQAYVPLLLVAIIVLLVVLLVTVIFLMKH